MVLLFLYFAICPPPFSATSGEWRDYLSSPSPHEEDHQERRRGDENSGVDKDRRGVSCLDRGLRSAARQSNLCRGYLVRCLVLIHEYGIISRLDLSDLVVNHFVHGTLHIESVAGSLSHYIPDSVDRFIVDVPISVFEPFTNFITVGAGLRESDIAEFAGFLSLGCRCEHSVLCTLGHRISCSVRAVQRGEHEVEGCRRGR